jgi:cytochrome P450
LKPRGLDALFDRNLPATLREWYGFVETNVTRRKEEEEPLQEKTDIDETHGRKDLFHYLFKATDDHGNPGYTTDELYAEANLLIIAGSDTTATTLVGFWFYIIRHPRVYDKLVEQIRTKFESAEDIRVGTKLSSCTYLQACIDEAMRLAPAGCSEMNREVLHGGLQIEGNHIPKGTHVGYA